MSRNTLLLFVVLLVPGCCWLSKRACFPACPPLKATRIIVVEKACTLPKLVLPAFKQSGVGCPQDRICFDRDNAAALYLRLAALKDFAKQARARCTSPTSRPTSKPATSQPSQ
jgi:hypothetical protein